MLFLKMSDYIKVIPDSTDLNIPSNKALHSEVKNDEEYEQELIKMIDRYSIVITNLKLKSSMLKTHYFETLNSVTNKIKRQLDEYNRKIGILEAKIKDKMKSIDKFNELIRKTDSQNPDIKMSKIEKLQFSLELEYEALKELNDDLIFLNQEKRQFKIKNTPESNTQILDIIHRYNRLKLQYITYKNEYKNLKVKLNVHLANK